MLVFNTRLFSLLPTTVIRNILVTSLHTLFEPSFSKKRIPIGIISRITYFPRPYFHPAHWAVHPSGLFSTPLRDSRRRHSPRTPSPTRSSSSSRLVLSEYPSTHYGGVAFLLFRWGPRGRRQREMSDEYNHPQWPRGAHLKFLWPFVTDRPRVVQMHESTSFFSLSFFRKLTIKSVGSL